MTSMRGRQSRAADIENWIAAINAHKSWLSVSVNAIMEAATLPECRPGMETAKTKEEEET